MFKYLYHTFIALLVALLSNGLVYAQSQSLECAAYRDSAKQVIVKLEGVSTPDSSKFLSGTGAGTAIAASRVTRITSQTIITPQPASALPDPMPSFVEPPNPTFRITFSTALTATTTTIQYKDTTPTVALTANCAQNTTADRDSDRIIDADDPRPFVDTPPVIQARVGQPIGHLYFAGPSRQIAAFDSFYHTRFEVISNEPLESGYFFFLDMPLRHINNDGTSETFTHRTSTSEILDSEGRPLEGGTFTPWGWFNPRLLDVGGIFRGRSRTVKGVTPIRFRHSDPKRTLVDRTGNAPLDVNGNEIPRGGLITPLDYNDGQAIAAVPPVEPLECTAINRNGQNTLYLAIDTTKINSFTTVNRAGFTVGVNTITSSSVAVIDGIGYDFAGAALTLNTTVNTVQMVSYKHSPTDSAISATCEVGGNADWDLDGMRDIEDFSSFSDANPLVATSPTVVVEALGPVVVSGGRYSATFRLKTDEPPYFVFGGRRSNLNFDLGEIYSSGATPQKVTGIQVQTTRTSSTEMEVLIKNISVSRSRASEIKGFTLLQNQLTDRLDAPLFRRNFPIDINGNPIARGAPFTPSDYNNGQAVANLLAPPTVIVEALGPVVWIPRTEDNPNSGYRANFRLTTSDTRATFSNMLSTGDFDLAEVYASGSTLQEVTGISVETTRVSSTSIEVVVKNIVVARSGIEQIKGFTLLQKGLFGGISLDINGNQITPGAPFTPLDYNDGQAVANLSPPMPTVVVEALGPAVEVARTGKNLNPEYHASFRLKTTDDPPRYAFGDQINASDLGLGEVYASGSTPQEVTGTSVETIRAGSTSIEIVVKNIVVARSSIEQIKGFTLLASTGLGLFGGTPLDINGKRIASGAPFTPLDYNNEQAVAKLLDDPLALVCATINQQGHNKLYVELDALRAEVTTLTFAGFSIVADGTERPVPAESVTLVGEVENDLMRAALTLEAAVSTTQTVHYRQTTQSAVFSATCAVDAETDLDGDRVPDSEDFSAINGDNPFVDKVPEVVVRAVRPRFRGAEYGLIYIDPDNGDWHLSFEVTASEPLPNLLRREAYYLAFLKISNASTLGEDEGFHPIRVEAVDDKRNTARLDFRIASSDSDIIGAAAYTVSFTHSRFDFSLKDRTGNVAGLASGLPIFPVGTVFLRTGPYPQASEALSNNPLDFALRNRPTLTCARYAKGADKLFIAFSTTETIVATTQRFAVRYTSNDGSETTRSVKPALVFSTSDISVYTLAVPTTPVPVGNDAGRVPVSSFDDTLRALYLEVGTEATERYGATCYQDDTIDYDGDGIPDAVDSRPFTEPLDCAAIDSNGQNKLYLQLNTEQAKITTLTVAGFSVAAVGGVEKPVPAESVALIGEIENDLMRAVITLEAAVSTPQFVHYRHTTQSAVLSAICAVDAEADFDSDGIPDFEDFSAINNDNPFVATSPLVVVRAVRPTTAGGVIPDSDYGSIYGDNRSDWYLSFEVTASEPLPNLLNQDSYYLAFVNKSKLREMIGFKPTTAIAVVGKRHTARLDFFIPTSAAVARDGIGYTVGLQSVTRTGSDNVSFAALVDRSGNRAQLNHGIPLLSGNRTTAAESSALTTVSAAYLKNISAFALRTPSLRVRLKVFLEGALQ